MSQAARKLTNVVYSRVKCCTERTGKKHKETLCSHRHRDVSRPVLLELLQGGRTRRARCPAGPRRTSDINPNPVRYNVNVSSVADIFKTHHGHSSATRRTRNLEEQFFKTRVLQEHTPRVTCSLRVPGQASGNRCGASSATRGTALERRRATSARLGTSQCTESWLKCVEPRQQGNCCLADLPPQTKVPRKRQAHHLQHHSRELLRILPRSSSLWTFSMSAHARKGRPKLAPMDGYWYARGRRAESCKLVGNPLGLALVCTWHTVFRADGEQIASLWPLAADTHSRLTKSVCLCMSVGLDIWSVCWSVSVYLCLSVPVCACVYVSLSVSVVLLACE